jgi:uncharacterized membrane protein YhiD involved in acid resistance
VVALVGSGAIVNSPERIHGMSTAVTLWLAGAIGAGVRYGRPLLAASLSLITVLALWTPALLKRIQARS